MGMRPMAVRTVIGGLSLALVLVGCGSDGTADNAGADGGGKALGSSAPEGSMSTSIPPAAGEETTPLGVAIATDGLLPAGAPLGDGVAVQEGSSLVGVPFPVLQPVAVGEEPGGVGWRAILVIEDDPIEVWGRYVAALGLESVAPAGQACVARRLETVPQDGTSADAPVRSRFLAEAVIEGENRLDCSVLSDQTEVVLAAGIETCGYQAPEDSGRCGPHAYGHMLVTVFPDPGNTTGLPLPRLGTDDLVLDRSAAAAPLNRPHDGEFERIPVPTGTVVPFGVPEPSGSSLPGPGEQLDAGLDDFLAWFDEEPNLASVPPGGRSLVAPALLIDCNSGLVAVLEVPGTADGVMTGLAAMTEPDEGGLYGRRDGTDSEGRAWSTGQASQTGGYYLNFTAVTMSPDRSTVLVTECGD